jgi:hypothetical protein
MRWFFEWWAGLNTFLKLAVAILLLGVSTAFWFAGRFWPWGWAAGIVLLLFSGPNDAQKKGYHDF